MKNFSSTPDIGHTGKIATIATFFADPRQTVRARAGLSLEAAARKARVTPAYLRQIEAGSRSASFYLAQRLASMYGCRIDLFLSGKPVKTGSAKGRKVGRR